MIYSWNCGLRQCSLDNRKETIKELLWKLSKFRGRTRVKMTLAKCKIPVCIAESGRKNSASGGHDCRWTHHTWGLNGGSRVCKRRIENRGPSRRQKYSRYRSGPFYCLLLSTNKERGIRQSEVSGWKHATQQSRHCAQDKSRNCR